MAQTQEALERLLEVGRLMSSKLDLPELLRTVLHLAANVVDAESASVLLLDEAKGELYFEQALDLGQAVGKVRLKVGEGIAGAVARSLKPEIVPDARQDPRWSPHMDEASGLDTRSILAVPMTIKGRLVGVVEAINKRNGGFTENDVQALEGFAGQAAVAIENARLFSSLKDERFKLRTIFGEMSDAAILADPSGVVLLANPSARRLLGEEFSSLDGGLRGFELAPPLRELLGGNAAREFDAEREKPVRLTLHGRATPVDAGWLFVLRDDTEARRRERLERSFLSLISHKLKTPLASVLGFSGILAEELRARPQESPVVKKAAESVFGQSRKLADLVDKLLRYATLADDRAPLALAPTPLDAAVEEALKSMKGWLDERGAEVVHRPSEPIMVRGDRDRLVDVVRGLVENAVKFDEKPVKRVAVWTERSGGQAVLTVKDEGPGIPPEELGRVFSRFHQIETYFTGQIDGWGLGLAYAKKIVEGHGGTLELRSRLGEGTAAAVRLPL